MMTVDIIKMLFIVVAIVTGLSTNVDAGISYRIPSSSLELPNVPSNSYLGTYGNQQAPTYNTYPYRDISYSVSHEGHHYLRQYKNGYQGPKYNSHYSNHYTNGNTGHYSHNNGNSEALISIPGGLHKNSIGNLQNAYSNFDVNNEVHSVPPVVSKHIYFHIPPPDVEEIPFQAPPPPPPQSKKLYNILFIKVPSQESKLDLQRLISSYYQQAPIEDKTLVYVLVKKPDPPIQVQLPAQQVTSEHEVFYVKYKGDPTEPAKSIKNQLDQIDSVHRAALALQPGLVNGHNDIVSGH